MNLQRTQSRAYGGGAYLRPLDEAEAKWLANAMFADARLDNCAWLVRYSTPGKPSEVLIEAARASWVDPSSALPAFADLIRRVSWPRCAPWSARSSPGPSGPSAARSRTARTPTKAARRGSAPIGSAGSPARARRRSATRPMMSRYETRQLVKALQAAGATDVQARMAAILYAVNGLANALEFVAKIPTFTSAPT